MTSAMLELQRSVLAVLKAGPALKELVDGRIYDRVPAGAEFPYVTLGGSTSYDWSTATERGSEHLLSLNVWDRAGGRKSVLEIMDLVDHLLLEGDFVLRGYRLINLVAQSSMARAEDSRDGYLGVLRYRIVTEELA